MIIQGSNNPLVIQFDTSVADMPALVVSLWSDTAIMPNKPLKQWNRDSMIVDNDTVVCPLYETETKVFPTGHLVLEAKGLDESGNTIFWDQYKLDVKTRRDRIIMLTQTDQTGG